MSTLKTFTAHPPAHTFDPSLATAGSNVPSLFSSLLPNFQGQGPIGSAVRIILKLHQHTARRISNSFGRESLRFGYKRKEEELRSKAIKVVDLLQHSAELGNMRALYTLAQVSLVCLFVCLAKYLLTLIPVPSYAAFPVRPSAGLQLHLHPCAEHWKRNFASTPGIFLQHRLPWGRSRRSSESSAVLHLRR